MSPSAPKDEDLAELTPLARLAFHYMPLIADCHGRLVDRPRYIKAELLPYDDVDMDELLVELSRERTVSSGPFILRYEVKGKRFIQILQFDRYQNPHPNEKKSYEKSLVDGRAIPPVPNQLDEDVTENVHATSSQHTARARSLDHGLTRSLDRGFPEIASVCEPPDPVTDDPEAAAEVVISEINRWLPDQRLKLNEGLLKPIANLLLCGDPGGVTKIRGDPKLFTLPDLIDLAHGYIVAESTNHWHIKQRARGEPYAFARLVRDSGRVAEYAETGRKLWDSWRSERSEEDEKAEMIAKCPRDHESEKEQRGLHWVCPALCGWNEVIRGKVEEPV